MAVSHGRFGGIRCSVEQAIPAPETGLKLRLIARASQREGDALRAFLAGRVIATSRAGRSYAQTVLVKP